MCVCWPSLTLLLGERRVGHAQSWWTPVTGGANVPAINELLEPMRERRAKYEGRDDLVLEILKAGCERANKLAESTLERVKHHANLVSWPRRVSYM